MTIISSGFSFYTFKELTPHLLYNRTKKKVILINIMNDLCPHISKQQTWWTLASSTPHVSSPENRKNKAAWAQMPIIVVPKLTNFQATNW